MTDPFDAAAQAGHQLQTQHAADQQTIGALQAQHAADQQTITALQTQLAATTPLPLIAWGVGPCNDAAALATEETALGRVDVFRYYQQAGEGITTQPFAFNGGRAVVYSSKVNPKLIASGAEDAAVTALFSAAVAAGVRLDACPWHEPENDIIKGTFTAADLRAAQAAYARLARQVDPQRQYVFVDSILMGYTLLASSGRTWTDYVDLASVDVLAWDPYQNSPTYEAPIGHLFDGVKAVAASTGKPWAIAETGVNHLKITGQAWYDTLTTVARECSGAAVKPVYVTYFDHDSDPTRVDNIIRNDPAAVAAWKAGQ